MSDQHDPFADRPYVPPTQRGSDDAPGSADSAGAAPSDATPGGAQQPTSEQPTTGQPTSEQPTTQEPFAEQPTTEQPAAPHAPAASEVPPQYSHQYAPPETAAASEPTVVLTGESIHGAPPAPRKKRRAPRLVAGAAAVALLAGAAGYGGAALYANTNDDGGGPVVSSLAADGTETSASAGQIEKVSQAVLPSVVQINVAGGQAAGSGTGIIISSDGDILTNNHVVEAAAEQGTVTVAFSDGTTAEAEIVGRDPKTDLAVIKVAKNGLTPAKFGSSSGLSVGQEVVAIGSPFGLESTVTSGIVSALNRPVSSSDGSGQGQATVFPAVQTDAAINPGNSGGPLVDLQGRVVGINSAIRSGGTTSASAGSVGLGFAIPIDLAKSVADQLVKGEKVEHALIGVTVRPAVDNDEITGIGAEITEVNDGSAGADAGLKAGDIVTRINDQPVSSSDALVAGIRGFRPGEKVTLTYIRDGKKADTEVTLDSDGGATSE